MTWQEALSHYFETHITLTEESRTWLKSRVDLDAQLVKSYSRDGLVARFAVHGELNHTRLIATLVWQTLGQVLAKKAKPIDGNLRSFWYRIADPIYSRKDLYSTFRGPDFERYLDRLQEEPEYSSQSRTKLVNDHTILQSYCKDLCEDVIQSFVEMKVFRYKGPLLFRDPHPNLHLMGEGRASFVFFVEKEGLYDRFCKKVYNKHEVTVIASKGFPSLLCLEYVADELGTKGITKVALAGLVDYEPHGFLIAKEYARKFTTLGFGIKGFTILTNPTLFTQEMLDNNYRDLTHVSPSKEGLTQAWFEQTGGIAGKRRGIQVDHVEDARVFKAVRKWYKDLIRTEDKEG